MDRRRAAGRRFVVNIGELLELATNGICALPSIAWCRRRRSSSASPSPSSSAPSLTRWCRFTPCRPSWRVKREAGQRPHNPLLRDVGWNYLKGRLRSHPDVAERYYQDVFRERAEQLIV